MIRYEKSLIIAGPTTTGKTDIAFRVGEEIGGEIINADKFYLVGGFLSMTGLPDFSDHSTVPHHLYEILHPTDEPLTDSDFVSMVRSIEQQIRDRGNFPIIEGCYHRFTKALLDSKRSYICVGIKWSSISDLESRVNKRVDKIFDEMGGIEEVREGLRKGWRDTYLMRKGSMIKPVVEYLDGEISLELARKKAVADIIYAAFKAYRRFLDIPEIRWVENEPSRSEEVTRNVIGIVKGALG